jgi:leader peptidase (prepilin peptidase)/N-methyltransferase
MDISLTFCCAVLGLAVGSFLNVVIYRVPRRASIIRPWWACPDCHEQIASRDNIPVVSWILRRGRCRACGHPISARYPLVEMLTGALFAGAALRFGWSWTLPPVLVLLAGLLTLACTDLELMLLPVRIVYPVLAGVSSLLLLAAVMTGQWHRLFIAGVCALVPFAVFGGINFVNPRWLAFGDVRLSLVIGLGLGWLGPGYAVLCFFVANLVGAAIGITLVAARRMTRSTQIPFGVFLALGAAAAIYAGAPILHWYGSR